METFDQTDGLSPALFPAKRNPTGRWPKYMVFQSSQRTQKVLAASK